MYMYTLHTYVYVRVFTMHTCRYCQKLPTDRYTVLAPEFEVILLPDNHSPSIDGHTYVQLYLATVHLPMSSPVNEATVCATNI